MLKALAIQLCSGKYVQRITKFIDQGLQFVVGAMWSRCWYLVSDYTTHPTVQEAPWQLAMNIGIEQSHTSVFLCGVDDDRCAQYSQGVSLCLAIAVQCIKMRKLNRPNELYLIVKSPLIRQISL